MRTYFMALSLIMFISTSAYAQEKTIEEVISSQIEAFRIDDVETAFSFASPMIHKIFRSPENFGNMVRNGYPMVWRPADVVFLRQKVEGETVYQEMRFVDLTGVNHSFVYEMIQVSGIWKINGVLKITSEDVSV
jgi:hypothetical protein